MVEDQDGEAAAGEALEGMESGQDSGGIVFAAACHEGGERIDNEEANVAVVLDGGDVVDKIVPGIDRRSAGEGPANPADVGAEAKAGIAACPMLR
jgi:hypothetical protein